MGILLRNDQDRYGLVALVLHWLIALAILAMIALGLVMTGLPDTPDKFALYQLHKSIGLTILLLSLLRLGWRLVNPVPPLPPTLGPTERVLARLTHGALYLLMIGLPLSGWAMVSASPWNIPTRWFDLVTVPHLPVLPDLADKQAAEAILKETHEILAFALIGLLVLHVGAALRHHFQLRDRTLLRMLPGRDLIRSRFGAQTWRSNAETGSAPRAGRSIGASAETEGE